MNGKDLLYSMSHVEENLRHVELFASEGWLWYTSVLAWGKYIIPIVGLCVVAKLVLRKK